MGYPTKLQCIKRKSGWRQFYLNIPAALAEALNCQEGEIWAFTIIDRKRVLLDRAEDKKAPKLKEKRASWP